MFMNEKTNKLINSIREVKIDGKMALVSLYDDLPHFEYDLTIDNLENSNKKLKSFIQELKQQIKKLKNENSHFKSLNSILSKNISSLYKTAKSEIQRKDKIIEELRKSKMYAPPTSKVFSYSNILPLEKTQNNQFSKEKNDRENVIKVAEKSNILNENNNDNLTNVVIKPNYDIPKTVYYTRLCKKLIQQNNIDVSKNELPIDIQNTNKISTGNIIKDKNEELNNDINILKETAKFSIHNDSENNPNSTLIICESDSSSSDCELNTTPINQYDNSEKGKENVSVESFFTRLKQPTKMKKKLVIAPATIGIQNMFNENTKSAEKLRPIRNLVSKTQHEIINSHQNQCLIKDIESTGNNEYDSKIVNKQLSMTDQISKNIKVEHVPVKEEIITEKDINSLMLKKVIKSSCGTSLSSSSDNELKLSSINVESNDNCLLINDEKELCSSSKLKNNQLDFKLSAVKHVSDLTEYTQLNDSVKNSSIDTSAETMNCFINIEVEQIPFKRKTIVIGKHNSNTTLNEVNKSSHETCTNSSINKEFNTSTKIVKGLSLSNETRSPISSKQKNSQLESSKSPSINLVNNLTESIQLNDPVKLYSKEKSKKKLLEQTSIPSTNIEVEQIPFRRKTIVIGKDSINTSLNEVRKSSHETRTSPSIYKEYNTSKRIVKCLSLSSEIKSPILSKQKNIQLESKSSAINPVKNLTESALLNDSVKHSSKEKSSKKRLLEQTSIPSTNIEVEQIPFRRKTIVIGKDSNNTSLNELRKSSHKTCSSPSINNEFNNSIRIVKCLSLNNEIKSPISSKQKNSQLESKSPAINLMNSLTESIQLNDPLKHYSKEISTETTIPSINIEVEQGSIFRRPSARRVITHSTSDDNKQETKKGRRVQLITIQDHFSQPLPSFNGAKKTEIDVSKNSIHIEKVVESSSHFYVPQVKRRRTMNFGNSDS